jgi:hypothetical protein
VQQSLSDLLVVPAEHTGRRVGRLDAVDGDRGVDAEFDRCPFGDRLPVGPGVAGAGPTCGWMSPWMSLAWMAEP